MHQFTWARTGTACVDTAEKIIDETEQDERSTQEYARPWPSVNDGDMRELMEAIMRTKRTHAIHKGSVGQRALQQRK